MDIHFNGYCYYNSCIFFFKQKTAYEIKECDWSSDVCSSDLCYRYYHPTLGRWLSRDPEEYVDGMGLYQAFRARPTKVSDPLGRTCVDTGKFVWADRRWTLLKALPDDEHFAGGGNGQGMATPICIWARHCINLFKCDCGTERAIDVR